MITKELLDFVKKEREKNVSDEGIKSTLTQNGWLDSDVEGAFKELRAPAPKAPPPKKPAAHWYDTMPETLEAGPRSDQPPIKNALLFLAILLVVGFAYLYLTR